MNEGRNNQRQRQRVRECLQCGMPGDVAPLTLEDLPVSQTCMKCDCDIYSQSDGRLFSCDIAHHQQTVREAMEQLDEAMLVAWQGNYQGLRLVVGGGLIRDEALGQLHYYQQCRYLLNYEEQSGNRGALIVAIRS